MTQQKEETYLIRSIFYVFIYYVLVYIVASTPLSLLKNTGWFSNQNQVISFSNNLFIGTHIITAICGIFLFKQLLKKDKEWGKHHLFKWILMVISGFFAILISGMFFIHGTSANENALTSMMNTMPTFQLILFKLVVVIVGPLNEEFIFREVLIGQTSHYLPKYLMWILSSLFFAYIHLPGISYWQQGIPYFINGAILGFVYIKSDNNVLVSYSLHFVNNFMSLIV